MSAGAGSGAEAGVDLEATAKGEQEGGGAPCPPRKSYRHALLLVLAGNTVVAAFLALLMRQGLVPVLVYSHAIGLSILALTWLGDRLLRERPHKAWVISALAIPLGTAFGVFVGAAYERGSLRVSFREQAYALKVSLATAVLFSAVLSYYFHAWARLAEEQARLRAEQLRREEGARRLAQAELKLLQAQIEPHFLFNTLSNVVQLVDTDPPRARRMLLDLTSYLRGALHRTRAGAITLGEELELVRAYLEIQAVRMGPRLSFTIACPEPLRGLALPPLLLQPLVENALRHGLEPKPGGGTVAVTAAREGDDLVLEVKDDGMGLDPRRPAGLGLANVRARVEGGSGGRGAVLLRPGVPQGLCVRISLPIEAAARADAAPPARPAAAPNTALGAAPNTAPAAAPGAAPASGGTGDGA